MANRDRELKDRTFLNGVPTYGRCSKCSQPFKTGPEAMTDQKKATKDFYAAFEGHRCEEDASRC